MSDLRTQLLEMKSDEELWTQINSTMAVWNALDFGSQAINKLLIERVARSGRVLLNRHPELPVKDLIVYLDLLL